MPQTVRRTSTTRTRTIRTQFRDAILRNGFRQIDATHSEFGTNSPTPPSESRAPSPSSRRTEPADRAQTGRFGQTSRQPSPLNPNFRNELDCPRGWLSKRTRVISFPSPPSESVDPSIGQGKGSTATMLRHEAHRAELVAIGEAGPLQPGTSTPAIERLKPPDQAHRPQPATSASAAPRGTPLACPIGRRIGRQASRSHPPLAAVQHVKCSESPQIPAERRPPDRPRRSDGRPAAPAFAGLGRSPDDAPDAPRPSSAIEGSPDDGSPSPLIRSSARTATHASGRPVPEAPPPDAPSQQGSGPLPRPESRVPVIGLQRKWSYQATLK